MYQRCASCKLQIVIIMRIVRQKCASNALNPMSYVSFFFCPATDAYIHTAHNSMSILVDNNTMQLQHLYLIGRNRHNHVDISHNVSLGYLAILMSIV